MKLPAPIFDHAKKYFAHHGCWHELRSPSYSQAVRNKCFPKGEMLPNELHKRGERGCGEDFLRFHRLMIRNFKWIIKAAPPPKYYYAPWSDFPNWLGPILDAMDPFYRRKLNYKLEDMINNACLDDLGQFIEGERNEPEFPHIHYTVHEIVADYEFSNFGPQPAANMGDPAVSAYNQHFWGFHGWIDEIYARWQMAHGEAVEQDALEPHMHKMCPECEEREKFDDSWLLPWKQYLKARSE